MPVSTLVVSTVGAGAGTIVSVEVDSLDSFLLSLQLTVMNDANKIAQTSALSAVDDGFLIIFLKFWT